MDPKDVDALIAELTKTVLRLHEQASVSLSLLAAVVQYVRAQPDYQPARLLALWNAERARLSLPPIPEADLDTKLRALLDAYDGPVQ